MKRLQIAASSELPQVDFNQETGELMVRGRSVPENGKEFYDVLFAWIAEYVKQPAPITHISFQLDYFNISSSKSFLFILYKLVELEQSGWGVKVSWLYSDAYILGAGRDYAFMVKLPFEFIKSNKREVAAA